MYERPIAIRRTAVFFQYPYRRIEKFYNIISCPVQYSGGKSAIRKIVQKAQLRNLCNCGVSTLVEDKQKWLSPRLRNVLALGNCHYSKTEAL
jgi:hypothetical protein